MGVATVAVLDVGKSNVKLSACTAEGAVVETLSTPNPLRPGPPWQHHDLDALNPWVMRGLAALSARHPLTDVVATGHGSAAALVVADPDAGGTGLALPMIDYDQPLPPAVATAYAPLAGGFADRGSALMMGASHIARQMVWAEMAEPAGFARAAHVLGLPQYWAWRLSGVAASEVSVLGAQSHLWRVRDGVWAPLVAARGWGRLLPPMARAGDVLGPVRPAMQVRWGLPPLSVHVGAHDSSVGFHRYQAAGLDDVVVISTGTWIVCMAAAVDPARLDETRGMTLNADMAGRPLAGALCMGGRDYAAIAGAQPETMASPDGQARLIAQGTLAVPSFGPDSGQFPGSAGKGRLIGPVPRTAAERHALAVLHVALLAVACGEMLAPERPWVLDGSFLRDPAFAGLVAGLRPGRETLVNPDSHGIASGAALLCRHGDGVVPLNLQPAEPLELPGLMAYARRWRDLAGGAA